MNMQVKNAPYDILYKINKYVLCVLYVLIIGQIRHISNIRHKRHIRQLSLSPKGMIYYNYNICDGCSETYCHGENGCWRY